MSAKLEFPEKFEDDEDDKFHRISQWFMLFMISVFLLEIIFNVGTGPLEGEGIFNLTLILVILEVWDPDSM